MARRFADRKGWERLLDRRFEVARVDRPGFHGSVTLLRIERVTAPLVVPLKGTEYRLVDAGFRWLQHFPDGAHHTLTTLLDERGEVVQWYFDVVSAMGTDERGVPWWDDLYLDVVVLPDRTVHLLDEGELDAARTEGEITGTLHALAHEEAAGIMRAVRERKMPLLEEWRTDLQRYFGGPSCPSQE